MTKASLALVMACLSLCPGLGAIERAEPQQQRGRKTSTSHEISVKPLYVYSARGRRDPFIFDDSYNPLVGANKRNFFISELRLTGFIGTGNSVVAIFSNTLRGGNYRMRSGKLFTPDGIAVSGVVGTVLPNRKVRLAQGESNITFLLPGKPKMESLSATIAQDRKESQP